MTRTTTRNQAHNQTIKHLPKLPKIAVVNQTTNTYMQYNAHSQHHKETMLPDAGTLGNSPTYVKKKELKLICYDVFNHHASDITDSK